MVAVSDRMTGAGLHTVARAILHGGALAVTAWALIATSAPDEPPYDCFTGLQSGDTYLRVTLSAGTTDAGPADASDDSDGSPSSADGGEAASLEAASPEASVGDASNVTSATTPSCGGIDGLSAGAVLDFHLHQGPRPSTGGGCYGYDTLALTGVTDVVLTPSPSTTGGSFLTRATGTFSSTSAVGCRGRWDISLAPVTLPARGQTLSPIDAGAGSRWNVVREIAVAQAQFCNGVFTQRGAIQCADTFPVERVSEHPGP
jgi:hypothetical protein